MSFTYDTKLDTDLDLVRFYLGDTEKGSGSKPNSGNFENEELTAMITSEGNWQLAVAAGFDMLSSKWAAHSSFSVHNGSFSKSDAGRRYAELAADWRKRFGEVATSPNRPGSIPVLKVDYGFE